MSRAATSSSRKTPKTKPVPREASQARVELFVEAYCATLNGTEAARRAGYKGSDVTLATSASRLLRKAKTREMIAARVKELSQEAGAQEAILRLWQALRADVADLLREELVVDWLIPEGKFPVLTLPHGAPPPNERAVQVGQYKRAVVDLERARAAGLTGLVKSLSFFPDGRIKSLALEDRTAARRDLLRLLGKDEAPTSAQELALALAQTLAKEAQAQGEARAWAWRSSYGTAPDESSTAPDEPLDAEVEP